MVTGLKKKILDGVLQHVISSEVKRLKKNSIKPTPKRVLKIVLKNADKEAIAMLLGQGYTTKELVKVTEDIIRRHECKE